MLAVRPAEWSLPQLIQNISFREKADCIPVMPRAPLLHVSIRGACEHGNEGSMLTLSCYTSDFCAVLVSYFSNSANTCDLGQKDYFLNTDLKQLTCNLEGKRWIRWSEKQSCLRKFCTGVY